MDSSNIPQDDDAPTLETKEMKKRGPTVMPKIVKGTSKRKKFQVNFNYKGQPIGKMRPKLSSMVGVWSRSLVPIMYTTWKKVPTEIKNKLWACVMTKLKKQVADGEISFQQGKDILTMALEKQEHLG
ncbi:hypothetical protein CICLE_v10013461mg [Citrus x clementina]|uniref:Uncharacterized protein n=1 Tax=Citrus clementina TaxID=85681 RepID=V4SWN6_CITCL|nr:hypothetical protein CICLE_v10013461mg [Citrus x clementina]